MKHGNVALRSVQVVCFVRPGIGGVSVGMAVQVEDFDDPFPDSLSVPNLFYRNTLTVRCGRTVEFVNDCPKIVYVGHAVALSKSPTLQKLGVTPAAIAGVQRNVL